MAPRCCRRSATARRRRSRAASPGTRRRRRAQQAREKRARPEECLERSIATQAERNRHEASERDNESEPSERPVREHRNICGSQSPSPASRAATRGDSTVTPDRDQSAAACTGPSVFHARNVPPWPTSATSANTPTSTVYQSRMPTGAGVEIGEERQREPARRRAAGRGAGCRARRRTGPAGRAAPPNRVPGRRQRVLDVTAELNRDAAQDQRHSTRKIAK